MGDKMKLKDKIVLVVGTGISGIASTELLMENEAYAILYDGNKKLTTLDVEKKLSGVKVHNIVIGEVPKETWDKVDLMVISPGVPIDSPIVMEAQKRKIEVWGEIELAYRCGKGRIAAITGTNGKTTTTAITGEIFANYFESSFVVGNIGTPYTSIVKDTVDSSVIAAEISSFQLESVHLFRPQVSAVLNITPDHLNRHYTMKNYAATKMNITKNQTKDQICVLNYEDEILKNYASKIEPQVLFFSSERKLESGIYLDGEDIVYDFGGVKEKIIKTTDTSLVGKHNIENIMAAAAISINMGVPIEIIRKTIKEFKAVEHRIEYTATKKGVLYYNDSKGTNPDASIKAIEAMRWPTILIAGGYDKNASFDKFIESFGSTVKKLVLLGTTKEQIKETALEHGFTDIITVETLEDAVKVAAENAIQGDAVLLSPACASWDMFDNYEIRGKLFKQYVNELED